MMFFSKLLRVTQSAERLPEDQRAVFEAMFYDGQQPEQICERLKITPAELEARTAAMARSLRAAAA